MKKDLRRVKFRSYHWNKGESDEMTGLFHCWEQAENDGMMALCEDINGQMHRSLVLSIKFLD